MQKIIEKLTILRKNKGVSQKEIADKLNIDVFEYMNIENMSKPFSKPQVISLLKFYEISYQEFMTTDYVLVEKKQEKLNINLGERPTIKRSLKSNNEETREIKFVKKLNLRLILVSIIFTCFALSAIIYFSKKENPKQPVYEIVNQPFEKGMFTNKYGTIVIEDDKHQFMGEDINKQFSYDEIKDLSKYAINNKISVALDTRGKLTILGVDKYLYKLEEEKQIIDISLGRKHLVAIDVDHNFICIKEDNYSNACSFVNKEEITNIKQIFAFSDYTIVVDDKHKIYTSDNLQLDKEYQEKPIKTIVGTSQDIWILYKDGTLDNIYGTKYQEAKEWEKVDDIVILKNALVTLSDGKIRTSSFNRRHKEAEKWEDIKYIGGSEEDLIAYQQNTIKGIGINQYKQYNQAIIKKETLKTPTIEEITVTENGVEVRFITDGKQIHNEVIIGEDYKVTVLSDEILIPLDIFQDNVDYVVSIQSKGGEYNSDSNVAKKAFRYYQPEIEHEQTTVVQPSIIPNEKEDIKKPDEGVENDKEKSKN